MGGQIEPRGERGAKGGRRRSHRWWHLATIPAAGLVAMSIIAASYGDPGASGSTSGRSSKGPREGGTLTTLENVAYIGDWTDGLDPATSNTTLANASLLDAIYGELFEVGPDGKLVPDLATAYAFGDGGKTLTLDLRHGVTFSDGTPFNAAAVVFNFERDLANKSSGSNPPWPAHPTIRASGPYSVVIGFSTPDGAAVNQLLDTNLTWIVSPTALKKLGEKRFSVDPVGAGPFEVVGDTESVKLVLNKNPHYWQAGHPYLSRLIFETVSSDEAALEALEAHDAQAYEYMTTPQLLSAFTSHGFTVTTDPGVSPLDVQINTIPPFDNLKAREALYYAIDASAIDKDIYHGTCPLTESFTGPGGLFYEPKVPGYRTYDLRQARDLVKSLGGLHFTLYYPEEGAYGDVAVALQTMFQDAGMKVTLGAEPNLTSYVAEYNTHKWTAVLASIGSFDPAGGIGVSFRLASNGPFSGIHSPIVDKYINAGEVAVSKKVRASDYGKLAEYLSGQAYTPFICTQTSWDIAVKGVSGPGLTSQLGAFGEGPLVMWQDVSLPNG